MVTSLILSIPTLVLPLLITPAGDCQFGRLGDPAADERAVAAFEVAINDYVVLHRRLARAWPPASLFADPEQAEAAAEALRTALRDARPLAAQGGFFTPEVADVLRLRITEALRENEYDLAIITWPPDGEEGEGWTPVLNQPVPWGTSGTKWPLYGVLPPLPPELAYRFIGRDLVLIDVHANLVIDILDLALPTAMSAPVREPPLLPLDEDFEGCRPEDAPEPPFRRDPNERRAIDEEE